MKVTSTIINSIAAATLAGLMLSGCGEEQQAKKEEQFAIPVEISTVTEGQVSSYYSTTATLEAPEEANVATRIAGVIEHIYVEEGDRVTKGQVLARIDARQQRYQLAHSEAEVKILSQELERYKKNEKPGVYQRRQCFQTGIQSAIRYRTARSSGITGHRERNPISD